MTPVPAPPPAGRQLSNQAFSGRLAQPEALIETAGAPMNQPKKGRTYRSRHSGSPSTSSGPRAFGSPDVAGDPQASCGLCRLRCRARWEASTAAGRAPRHRRCVASVRPTAEVVLVPPRAHKRCRDITHGRPGSSSTLGSSARSPRPGMAGAKSSPPSRYFHVAARAAASPPMGRARTVRDRDPGGVQPAALTISPHSGFDGDHLVRTT